MGRKPREPEPPERWRDVPGFEGRYQASNLGRVRRVNGNGTYLMLKPYTRKSGKNRRTQKIWMVATDGSRRERAVLSVVAATWSPPPPGYIVIHRNGMFGENDIDNIRYITRRDLPEIYPVRASRRVVCKTDGDGNVIECYSSARQAARENYMNLSTLYNHLNGRVINPRTTEGICYRWEDDADVSQ